MVTRLAGDQEMDIYGRRLSLFADLNLLDHVAKFDGFYSLDLREFAHIFNLVYFTTNNTSPLQDFVGIAITGNPTNAVDWIGRDSFLPMITAGQKPVIADSASTVAALGDASFEPRRIVYLPLEAQGRILATNAASAQIVSSRFTRHSLAIEVEQARRLWWWWPRPSIIPGMHTWTGNPSLYGGRIMLSRPWKFRPANIRSVWRTKIEASLAAALSHWLPCLAAEQSGFVARESGLPAPRPRQFTKRRASRPTAMTNDGCQRGHASGPVGL